MRDDALKALFKKFDEDGSGTIDGDELRKMAKVILGADGEMEPKNLEQDMQYLMKELDKDGDGNITFEEMRVGLSKWIKEQKAEQEAAKKTQKGPNSENSPLMAGNVP